MLNEEKEQQKKKQIHRIAQIVLAGIAIVCILYLVVHTVRQAMIQRQYEQMSQESVVVQAEVTEQIEAQIYGPVPKVDFDTLWQTNADICADVIVIENNKKMWLSEVVSEVKCDDGKTRRNLARFQGQKSPMIDWTNAENLADFKRQLEMAVCKFKVNA